MHHMQTSSEERVRLTITVTPEVYAAFRRLSASSGMSLGRAMGEWLGDTLEAVEFTAAKVEEARAAPKLVMRELHAYALGLADETGAAVRSIVGSKSAVSQLDALGRGARERGVLVSPPLSNTGGKVPRENPKKGRK
jgi:hypothetical protein